MVQGLSSPGRGSAFADRVRQMNRCDATPLHPYARGTWVPQDAGRRYRSPSPSGHTGRVTTG